MHKRKMASIRTIDAINAIPDADAIEVATIGGWKVVIKKDEFNVGDTAVYCEIDSWIPTELAPFLSKGNEPREYESIRGERLRTVRLRNQLSQGLLLPLGDVQGNIGDDVSELLGIVKYEPPVPAQISGEARGMFPGFIPKTDQERIQNLNEELTDWIKQDATWEVTEKLDGSSMTVYVFDEDEGVCSRNLNLRETKSNTMWRVAREQQLIEKLRSTGRNLALQGEIIGNGIQKNPYKINAHDFRLFDIYDIDTGEHLRPEIRRKLATELGIESVPVLDTDAVLDTECTIDFLLEWAEDKSVLNDGFNREGLVFKSNTDRSSFKVISNKFLLKGGN